MTTNNQETATILIQDLDNSKALKPLRIRGENADGSSDWYSAFDKVAEAVIGAGVGARLTLTYTEKPWQSASGGSGINRTIRRATLAAASQPQPQPQSQPPAANSSNSRDRLIVRQVALKEASAISQTYLGRSDAMPKLPELIKMVATLTNSFSQIVLDESIEETIEPPAAEPDFLENI